MKIYTKALLIFLSTLLTLSACAMTQQKGIQKSGVSELSDLDQIKGKLLYQADMTKESVSDWIMEGPGVTEFKDGWMTMYSPNEAMHHVFWNPVDFPDSFIAQWEVQKPDTDYGLAIVFFAAKGLNGEDIFDPSLPQRDGTFKQYTEGKIKSYHISYFAHAAHNPDRPHANLRKNNTFTLLQSGAEGIAPESTDIHKITLIKIAAHIRLYIDEREVINFTDTGIDGDILSNGKIGLRQMQWTTMKYRNFMVWSIR